MRFNRFSMKNQVESDVRKGPVFYMSFTYNMYVKHNQCHSNYRVQ